MSITLDDIETLSGWFIGSFGVGLCAGFLIGVFFIICKTLFHYL